MTLYALGGLVPKVPEDGDFWVAPGAHVIGDVTIGTGATVWFGSTLRGDTEPIVVGPGSNIQENCVLHTDPSFPLTVGAECTIGHKAILHGCTVDDGTLIGMGAIILNGAGIGRGALVGAGALVTEGKEIPPGALVTGAPARVIRILDDAERRKQAEVARHYRERMKDFRNNLTILC